MFPTESIVVAQKDNKSYYFSMTKLQATVDALIKRHGSLRKAEAATGINYAYLHKLRKGEKISPSTEVLAKLGLEKRSTYRSLA